MNLEDEILIDALFDEFYARSFRAGWWKIGPSDSLEIGTKFALIHSEISEAMEGYRVGAMDEHLPNRPSIEVELADAVIRIGDLAGRLGLDVGGAIREKLEYNARRADHTPAVRNEVGGKKF